MKPRKFINSIRSKRRESPSAFGDFIDSLPDSYVRSEYPREWEYRRKTRLPWYLRML